MLDDVVLQGEVIGECDTGDGAVGGVNGESLNSHSSLFALSEAGLGKDWHILQQSIKQSGQVLDHDGIPRLTLCIVVYAFTMSFLGARISISPVARPMTAPARSEFFVTL